MVVGFMKVIMMMRVLVLGVFCENVNDDAGFGDRGCK